MLTDNWVMDEEIRVNDRGFVLLSSEEQKNFRILNLM